MSFFLMIFLSCTHQSFDEIPRSESIDKMTGEPHKSNHSREHDPNSFIRSSMQHISLLVSLIEYVNKCHQWTFMHV